MSIRKTANELVEAMLQSGVSPTAIKKVLGTLGFSKEKIDELTEDLPTISVSEEPRETNAVTSSENTLSLREELERHRSAINSLQEELSKINSTLSPFLQGAKASRDSGIISIEKRLSSLEAEVKGVIEALGEYVPALLKRSIGGT